MKLIRVISGSLFLVTLTQVFCPNEAQRETDYKPLEDLGPEEEVPETGRYSGPRYSGTPRYEDNGQGRPETPRYLPLDERRPYRRRPLPSAMNDRRVGVNIPGIYEMDLLTGGRGTGLGINVLGGLVRVNLNRNRNPYTGHRRGPISVQVGK